MPREASSGAVSRRVRIPAGPCRARELRRGRPRHPSSLGWTKSLKGWTCRRGRAIHPGSNVGSSPPRSPGAHVTPAGPAQRHACPALPPRACPRTRPEKSSGLSWKPPKPLPLVLVSPSPSSPPARLPASPAGARPRVRAREQAGQTPSPARPWTRRNGWPLVDTSRPPRRSSEALRGLKRLHATVPDAVRSAGGSTGQAPQLQRVFAFK